MVVTLRLPTTDARTLQCLVVRERGEHTEDDGNSSIELDAHKRVRNGFADVLEVHRGALNENADGDNRVERLVGDRSHHGCRSGGPRVRVERSQAAEKVSCCCAGLDMRTRNNPTRG